MRPWIRIIVRIVALVLLIADAHFFALNQLGPIARYRAICAQFKVTQGQGLKPCITCGRPGEEVRYEKLNAGDRVYVYCRPHTDATPHESAEAMLLYTSGAFVLACGTVFFAAGKQGVEKVFVEKPGKLQSLVVPLAILLSFHVLFWGLSLLDGVT